MPLYIGELLLGAFFVLMPSASGRRFADALLRWSPVGGLSWAIFCLIAYGVVLAARGVLAGFPKTFVAQELVFNVYPLFLFLGLWLGERAPALLPRFLRVLAWLNGIYGIAYIVFLNNLFTVLPGTQVYLFKHPAGQAFLLLALLAYRAPGPAWKTWTPFALNAVVLLATQSRASWAGFVIGLVVWAVMSRRVGRTLAVGAAFVALMGVAWIADLRVPGARGPGEYSARNVVGAAIAPFDEQLASQYTNDAENFAGTTQWRQTWWSGIWRDVTSDRTVFLVGHGYGFELTSTAVLRSSDPTLRTPHNWFFYAIGYGGILGVAIFVAFLFALGRLLWSAYRRTGDAFGLPFLLLCLTTATFAPFWETPFAAIPAYVIAGMAAAPAMRLGAERPAGARSVRRVDARGAVASARA
jgi:hypothetical protein